MYRRRRHRHLVGDRPGQLHPGRPGHRRGHDQSVQYNPTTRTALARRFGLTADQYTLTVGDSIVSARTGWRLLGALRHALHRRQRPVAVRLARPSPRTRSDRNTRHGLLRRDDREHQPVQPAGAHVPDPRPRRRASPARPEGDAELERELADQPQQHGARRRRAGAGAEHDRPDGDDRRPRRAGDRLHLRGLGHAPRGQCAGLRQHAGDRRDGRVHLHLPGPGPRPRRLDAGLRARPMVPPG